MQELERGDSGLLKFCQCAGALCMHPIATFEQAHKQKYLPKMAKENGLVLLVWPSLISVAILVEWWGSAKMGMIIFWTETKCGSPMVFDLAISGQKWWGQNYRPYCWSRHQRIFRQKHWKKIMQVSPVNWFLKIAAFLLHKCCKRKVWRGLCVFESCGMELGGEPSGQPWPGYDEALQYAKNPEFSLINRLQAFSWFKQNWWKCSQKSQSTGLNIASWSIERWR